MGYKLVDAFIYAGVSLLHLFYNDNATIDKTLFYDIKVLENLRYTEHTCNYVVI